MRIDPKKAYQKALELDAEVYHFHDPELLPVGLKLKRRGKKVIFDAHEDLPKQLLSKPYLNKITGIIISGFITVYEKIVCRKYDFILTATPSIRDKFLQLNKHVIDINNYPLLGELHSQTKWQDKQNEVCYVGGITEIRGIKEVVKAFETVDGCKLNLAGEFSAITTKDFVSQFKGWSKVNEFGLISREEVQQLMARSKAGIVTFLPFPNHIDAQPNKMFEYMSAGLPVIASHFPLWREIVEGNNCGICVDPEKPEEIANTINYILQNDKEAANMGANGRNAVLEKYNWGTEEKKLLHVYNQILKIT
jgi:glycosyltransferase involved in cell wall biosynthesis